jgi:quinolinate synthase
MNNIEEDEIIFLPDRNLGEFISDHFPNKNFILYQGFCPTHERVEQEDILKLMKEYPEYEVLVHPECNKGVRTVAHYIGSTSELINYSASSNSKGFIVVTEEGVLHQMKKKSPNKVFIPLKESMICPNMKMTTLEEVYKCLLDESNEIIIEEDKRIKALKALENMHLLGDD